MKSISILILVISGFSCSAQQMVLNDPYEMVQIVGGENKLMKLIDEELEKAGCIDTGKVFMQVLVNTKGLIEKHRIIKSESEKLDSLSEAIVNRLEFIPAKRNGKAYKAYIIIPFNFYCD